MPFDTHGAVQTLRESGQSEGEAEAVVDVIQDATGELVTTDAFRAEMAAFGERTSRESEAFRTEMRREFDEFRTEMRRESEAFRADMRREFDEFRTEVRGDIAEVRGEIAGVRTEMAELRGEMRAQTEQLRGELYRALWFFGTGIVLSVGAIVGVIVTVVSVID